jgi:hypothetical protein
MCHSARDERIFCTVAKHNVDKIEDRPVVGGHDQGHAFGADDAAQQGEQIPPGCRVEFAGRFIRQQETRT